MENKTFKKVLNEVKETVESGSTFAEALGKHPKVFDQLYVQMVRAGEIGGILDTILNRLATSMEKTMRLKKQIKSAMIYPAIREMSTAGLITCRKVKQGKRTRNVCELTEAGWEAYRTASEVWARVLPGLQKAVRAGRTQAGRG